MNTISILRLSTLLLLSTIFNTIFTACDDDDDDKCNHIVWIDDDEFAGLPAYTEQGYNTFGAYINGQTFTSNRNEYITQISFQSGDQTLTLSLEPFYARLSPTNIGKLSFTFPYSHINKYTDLRNLQGTKIDLTNNNVEVQVLTNSELSAEQTITVESGELNFQRVQILTVDNEVLEAIVSGTFEFNGSNDQLLLNVTHGRFDAGVDANNFSF